MSTLWTFGPNIGAQRAERLVAATCFRRMVRGLQRGTTSRFRWKPFEGKALAGCGRAEFSLEVEEDVFDAFYNAPAGYRGQYAISPERGELANDLVLTRLSPMLLTHSLGLGDFALIAKSLSAKDAKVWIDEDAVWDQLNGPPTDIVYRVWQEASYGGGTGLIAPIGTIIEVKGGWVDSNGVERRNAEKSFRSTDIHRTGWTPG